MLKILCFKKNTYICNTEKKQLELTIMEKNYRITVILKDEVRRTYFSTKEKARFKMEQLKELYPKSYIIGALEEKRKKWEVTWMLV